MNRAFRPNETSRPGFKAGLGGFARLTLFGAASSLALALGSTAYALPSGGSVAAGAATLSSGANTLTVNQSSQNAVLNWQSFSIAQGEAVRFAQPNSSSVALNRVTGPDPSSILGSLSANGKVFLVNPNGILFGANAQVNVGGLVASTLNISDADFMAAREKEAKEQYRQAHAAYRSTVIAASTKASSLSATRPLTRSATRSPTEPNGVTTQGTPNACASASARQKVSPTSPR